MSPAGMRNFFSIIVGFLLAISADYLPGQQREMTIKIPYKGKSYSGQPMVWDGREMMLLRRDGKISILPVHSDRDYQTVSDQFRPYSADAMRTKLQQEFGSKYQVSVTRNFVVVHPPGDYQVWAMPFEELYHRFDAYFSSRGFGLDQPQFPLVAVVLRTRSEFDYFLRTYQDYDRHVLGYYSPTSNRIITYDQSSGRSQDPSWFFTVDTMIHEAAHQTAFNTGIHSRFAPVPRWISEGLAMLFEAPGVNNSMHYAQQSDRINRQRLIELQTYYRQGRVSGKLASLITSDRLFQTDANLAYAMAWGLTFYLSEKQPDEYFRFLNVDGKRSDFEEFSAKDRARAFSAAFGSKLADLDARMEQFIVGLDIPARRK